LFHFNHGKGDDFMLTKRRLILRTALTLVAGIFGALMVSVAMQPTTGYTADHGDSPSVASGTMTDLTDLYAFRSPSDTDNLVMNVSPHMPGSPPSSLFADGEDSQYLLHVDTDGVLTTDEATIRVTFSNSPQRWKVEGLTPQPLEGFTTPIGASSPNVFDQGGIEIRWLIWL
jgi:hypothetical protein